VSELSSSMGFAEVGVVRSQNGDTQDGKRFRSLRIEAVKVGSRCDANAPLTCTGMSIPGSSCAERGNDEDCGVDGKSESHVWKVGKPIGYPTNPPGGHARRRHPAISPLR